MCVCVNFTLYSKAPLKAANIQGARKIFNTGYWCPCHACVVVAPNKPDHPYKHWRLACPFLPDKPEISVAF